MVLDISLLNIQHYGSRVNEQSREKSSALTLHLDDIGKWAFGSPSTKVDIFTAFFYTLNIPNTNNLHEVELFQIFSSNINISYTIICSE